MRRPGELLKVVPQVSSLPDGIAPAGPIHAKPVVPFDSSLRFELEFSKGGAAVGFRGACDFLENVQFGHRHSFLGYPLDCGE